MACFFVCLCDIFFYFKVQKKDNLFDFDSIFLLILCICFYAYPVFIYNNDNIEFVFFNQNEYINIKYIGKSIAISTIAICSYCLGAISENKKVLPMKHQNSRTYINTGQITLVFCALTLLGLSLGSVDYYKQLYSEGADVYYNPLLGQISALTKALFYTICGTEFYNIYNGNKKINYPFLIVALLDASLMLTAGNRTLASEYLIAIAFFIFYRYHKVRLVEFIAMMLIAFVSMFFIQMFRQDNNATAEFGIQIISDFVYPYRLNVVSIEYVEKFGILWGSNFLTVLGVIPGLTSLINSTGFDAGMFNSAYMFTQYEKASSGLGTTLQADAYLSFGVLGVLGVFYFIGKYVRRVYKQFEAGDYYAFIAYGVIIGHAVYWVRSFVFTFATPLVWALLFAYLNIEFFNKRNKRIL